jgi:hypothetical protein
LPALVDGFLLLAISVDYEFLNFEVVSVCSVGFFVGVDGFLSLAISVDFEFLNFEIVNN